MSRSARNLPLTSAVIATNGTIAAYGSDAVAEPALPFYPLMRRGVTIRTVRVFTMPPPAMRAATEHVNRLLVDNVLTHPVAARFPLAEIAAAHRLVESGTRSARCCSPSGKFRRKHGSESRVE